MEVDASWAQGRALFGGVLVTGLLRAMERLVPEGRRLRTAQVTFVAPAAPGVVDLETAVLRSGKAITTIEGRAEQEGSTALVVVAGFGADRETGVAIEPPLRPEAPPPDALPAFAYLEGVTPDFTKHFDYRFATAMPFTGAPEARVGGWIRPRDEVRVDAAVALGLIDAWPPPVWALVNRPAPASSLTWQVNIVGELHAGDHAADRWWYFDGRSLSSSAGYADCEGLLWDPDGRLFATSRQLFVEFTVPGTGDR